MDCIDRAYLGSRSLYRVRGSGFRGFSTLEGSHRAKLCYYKDDICIYRLDRSMGVCRVFKVDCIRQGFGFIGFSRYCNGEEQASPTVGYLQPPKACRPSPSHCKLFFCLCQSSLSKMKSISQRTGI